MKQVAICLVLAAILAACGGLTSTPTPHEVPSAPPILPLPANLSGIPGPTEVTAEVSPHSPDGELTEHVRVGYQLGHCGLVSPVDIDGSLWDPTGYWSVTGAPATSAQEGELINATPVEVVLSPPDTLEMRTPAGLTVFLERHDGSRDYFLCD